MKEKGNVYSEIYTQRQFDISFYPIIFKEYERARVLEALGGGERSVPEIAKQIGMEPNRVLMHIVELRRRGKVSLVGLEGTTPMYKREE